MRFNSIRFLGLSILAVCIVGNSPRGWAQDKDNAEVTVSATATKIDAAGKQKVTVTFDMQKDWHIYANPVKNKSFASSQTRVAVKARVKLADVKITYPKGKLHEDKDEGSSMIYEDRAVVEIAVQRAPDDTSPLEIEYAYNACNDVIGTCLLPKKAKITLP